MIAEVPLAESEAPRMLARAIAWNPASKTAIAGSSPALRRATAVERSVQPASEARFWAISFNSAFCGSANFFSAFAHQRLFHVLDVRPSRSISSSIAWAGSLSTSRVNVRPLRFDRVVRGRRIGFDVATGQGRHVFPGRIVGLLRAGAGEHQLLVERQLLVLPELLVLGPDALGAHDAHHALRGRRQLRERASRCRRRPATRRCCTRS